MSNASEPNNGDGYTDVPADGPLAIVDQYAGDLARGDRTDAASWLAARGSTSAELAGRLHVVELAHALRETQSPVDQSTAKDPYATVVPHEQVFHPIVKRGALLGGKYRILDRLGAGGMGEVFVAWHTVLNCEVAVKVLPERMADCHDVAIRFQQSVQAQARLGGHKNIVATMDAGEEQGFLYLVMEYVHGQDLAAYLTERGPLPWREGCDCIRQAAEGLAHAHDRGLIHRDIKPGNLIRCDDGTIKLLDWGLARYADGADSSRLTQFGMVMGTADYMAPEQADDSSAADTRSDLYSLGCTLYCLLAGEPPFAAVASFPGKLAAHRVDTPRPTHLRPDVPVQVTAIVGRLLQKHPDLRYQSATEMVAALKAIEANDLPALGASNFGSRFLAIAAFTIAVASTWIWWPVRSPIVGTQREPSTEASALVSSPPAALLPEIERLELLIKRDLLTPNEHMDPRYEIVVDGKPCDLDAPDFEGIDPLTGNDGIRLEGELRRSANWYLVWLDTNGMATLAAFASNTNAINYPIEASFIKAKVNSKDPPGTHLLLLLVSIAPLPRSGNELTEALQGFKKPPQLPAFQILSAVSDDRETHWRGPGERIETDSPRTYLKAVETRLPETCHAAVALFIQTKLM